MTKRTVIENIDEDFLREVMAGNAKMPKKSPPEMKEAEVSLVDKPPKKEKNVEILPESPVEPKETTKPVRKKREEQDYASVFLARKASSLRRQVYMDASLYDKINSFLPLIAGHLFGITTFINNVLTHHLEHYREDINELYELKTKKPL
jgi:hypothetical protein